MKKTFIKVTLICALLVSAPLSFTSCTEYDTDIERLDGVNKALTTQIAALEKAHTASNTEVDAAKAAAAQAKVDAAAAKAIGDAAALSAAQANAEAELAKQAAAQAKADAIAHTTAEVKKLMEITATKEEVKALAARIDGIEKGLNTLSTDVADVKSQLIKFNQALDIQTAALENYKILVNQQLAGIGSDISGINTKIDGLIAEMATVKAEMATKTELNTTKVELENKIKEASDKIMKVLGSRIDTLIGTLINRLTSITLIPSVYIDGIPAIDFRSVAYAPKEFVNGNLVNIADKKTVVVSNGKTFAKYRLNPMGIGASDIVSEGENRPAFMEDIAESRSTVRSIIDIESFDVKDGEMTVYAKKAEGFTGSYDLEGKMINIVSLRLTNKNLFEGEVAKDATVYSEYVRLAETTFTPEIAALPFTNPVNHYNDSTTLYTSAIDKMIDADVNYNKSIDLNLLATGCTVIKGNHENVTAEELKSYGLEFKFEVAKAAYELNSVDQQIYAKLDNKGMLTSQVPAGETNMEIAVDKQPIIRVSLVDVKHGNLVDQRYIKVKFTKDVQPSIDLGNILEWKKILGCENIVLDFTMDQMKNLVYSKLNGDKGITAEDFAKHYTQFTVTGPGTVVNNTATPTAPIALTWTLTADDIKKIVPETSKTFEVDVKFSDPRQVYGDATFKLSVVISLETPTLNGYNQGYWKVGAVGSVLRITPIHLTDPNRTAAVCEYNSNIWNAFTLNNSGTLVNGLGICGAWDMQFAVDGQLAGFKPGNTTEPNMLASDLGYKLMKSGVTAPAATLNWDASHTAWAGIPTNTFTRIMLDKNNGGKDLVGKMVKVGIWANSNSYNTHKVTKFDLEIVTPLTINASLKNGIFYDHVYGGSKISCGEAFTMTDFAKYVVAKKSSVQYAEELYKYYEVQEPAWDVTNAKIGMKMENGNLVIDDALIAGNSLSLNSTVYANSVSKDGDNLIFNNNSGLNVETPFNIFIMTNVTYGWGTAEEWVTIRVMPSLQTRK